MKRLGIAVAFCVLAAEGRAECLSEAATHVMEVAERFDCRSEPGVCRGTYELGAPVSRDNFDVLRQRLAACAEEPPERDRGVNHPDFYDAYAFTIDGARVTLSIKDKSALSATFVVVRGLMSETPRN